MFDCTKKIRYYRERKLLTQGQLAKILVWGFITICSWETRRFEHNMAMKKKLIGLFDEAGMKIE